MKVSQLRQIIKEEISKVLNEAIYLEKEGGESVEIDITTVVLKGYGGNRYIAYAETVDGRELTDAELNDLQDQEGVLDALDTETRD